MSLVKITIYFLYQSFLSHSPKNFEPRLTVLLLHNTFCCQVMLILIVINVKQDHFTFQSAFLDIFLPLFIHFGTN